MTNKKSEKKTEKKFMTVKEVAEELNLTPKGVQRLCRDKKIGFSKPGKSYLIPRASLDEYLQIRR